MPIDISDLDIKILFKELWMNTITAAFFSFNNVQPPSYEEPEKYNMYFDYHCGRPIKTEFFDLTNVETRGYNRNAGPNKFEEIVSKLRKN